MITSLPFEWSTLILTGKDCCPSKSHFLSLHGFSLAFYEICTPLNPSPPWPLQPWSFPGSPPPSSHYSFSCVTHFLRPPPSSRSTGFSHEPRTPLSPVSDSGVFHLTVSVVSSGFTSRPDTSPCGKVLKTAMRLVRDLKTTHENHWKRLRDEPGKDRTLVTQLPSSL